MGAEDLRSLVRSMLLELDDRAHGRVVNSILGRAARGESGWAPAALRDDDVEEVLASVEAAKRVGYADPSSIDQRLQRGAAAFLRRDYPAAHRIFGALLRPIGEGEIDLGQDEMVDEVLGVDPSECAAQYVVSAYMISESERRTEAVREAIDEVDSVGHFWEPVREMERVAVEPLVGLDDFLPRWRALVGEEAGRAPRQSDWGTDADRWLREAVRRLEGSDGLAQVARSTRRADDLRAWCLSLVEARNWKAALSAFEEAAELVTGREYARGELLDGAALAAQELGKKDLSAWLERAWRGAPSMPRLRRWLGSAGSKVAVKRRAAEALEACPKKALRQRALLFVLGGDFESAAKILAEAPGLGWSDAEHPGHLLFPLFRGLLGGEEVSMATTGQHADSVDVDELELLTADRGEPHLATPELREILRQAGVGAIRDGAARREALAAMRNAAEKRLAGITNNKRRRHYGHGAELVASSLACDRSPEALRWVESLRTEYRRYPALRAEFDRRLRSS